ncbi:MAG: GTP-dependent phosphoenolpyruvate carboxykinase, partial [Gammaproteobacteria bacterium]
SDEVMSQLTTVNIGAWETEMDSVGEYLKTYGDRLPAAVWDEYNKTRAGLKAATEAEAA